MSEKTAAPVSVVIPAYNAEEFLGAAIESVRCQQRRVAELIVVDDASIDDTPDIADSMAATVVQHERNRGQAAARNTGIRASTQRWIAFLDADDVWKPHKIQRQWTALESVTSADLVFCDREHFRGQEILCAGYLRSWDPYLRAEKVRLYEHLYRCESESLARALCHGGFMTPSTLVVRRDLLHDVGLFDERFGAPGSGIGAAEDIELSFRLLTRTDPLVVEEPLVEYRIREDSLSADDRAKSLAHVYLAEKMENHPDQYPQSAVTLYPSRWKSFSLRRAATLAMHESEFARARRLYWKSLLEQPHLKAFAGVLVATGGQPVYRALLWLKRKFGLRGLR